jgi:hypothetical protein
MSLLICCRARRLQEGVLFDLFLTFATLSFYYPYWKRFFLRVVLYDLDGKGKTNKRKSKSQRFDSGSGWKIKSRRKRSIGRIYILFGMLGVLERWAICICIYKGGIVAVAV